MYHVPVEVLHLIFSQLELRDRLECMLVCQFWHNTLDRRSLLQDVCLTGHRYPYFKDMIERLPYRGNQVEKIVLEISQGHNFDKRKLCNMLPNLRQVEMIDLMSDITRSDYMSKKFHLLHGETKLERIVDFGECELTRQLALSDSCRYVHTLVLNFIRGSTLPISAAVPHLKNMPVLEYLQLSNAQFTLMDLELLHSNLPSVIAFVLSFVDILAGDTPLQVEPVTSLTELNLQIHDVDDIHTHIQFYKYITKKYPSLEALDRIDLDIRDRPHDYTRDVYNEAILPLYQMLAPHLDTFTFENFCVGLNAFRKFDDAGMQLDELIIESPDDDDDDIPFLEELVLSQQSKTIRRLELAGVDPDPLNIMGDMEVLEVLSIIYSEYDYEIRGAKKRIHLDHLVEGCPVTLTYLYIDYVSFTFTNPISKLTSITDLRLLNSDFTPDLAKAIETSFPKLSILELSGDVFSNWTLSLPNHHLKEICISTCCKYKRNAFSIKTISDDKLQFYALKRTVTYSQSGRILTNDKVIPVSQTDFDDPFILEVICASAENVTFAINAY